MTRPLKVRVPLVPVSYTVPDASLASGLTADDLNKAIEAGELTAHWMGPRKKVVLAKDLEKYIESFPTERPERY